MELHNRKRRVSAIPRIPDDDSEEVITVIPGKDKTLPPLPVPAPMAMPKPSTQGTGTYRMESNSVSDQQSNLSATSSVNTKSSIGITTPMKSGPVVSATPTNAERSIDDLGLTKDEANAVNKSLYQIQKDNLEQEEELRTDRDSENGNVVPDTQSAVGSFMKNITSYTYRTQNKAAPDENLVRVDHEQLADGIKFETEKGTEMLSYRKSRGKNGHTRNQPSIDTVISNGKQSSGLIKEENRRSVSSPVPASSPPTGIFASPSSSVMSPTASIGTPKAQEIDYNLYVDEKYLDTQYRYACERRNSEFHQLFPEVTEDDRLLDDFSCALSREILLQGRIYISEHFLCFNSSLLGWVTTLVISLDEIQKFERRSTAGLFPNGIIIETREARHIFASFLSRDSTLNFIETVWSKSITLSKSNHEKEREVELIQSKSSFDEYKQNKKRLSESDIYTIDDESDDYESGDAEEDEEDTSEDEIEVAKGITDSTESKRKNTLGSINKGPVKVKKILNKFPGQKRHSPSTHNHDYTGSGETIVLEGHYEAPLGLIFNILYGADIDFHKSLMILNDGMNFTEYGGLQKQGDERTFEYDKKLNYPIGPSSTRVYCTERVEHYDMDDYVEVLNISKTPNVPSGNAFDCRTRYTLQWGADNMTKVTISFKLAWTGSSWFKSVIESSTLSGQKKAADDLNVELRKILPAKVLEFDAGGADETEAGEETDKADEQTEKPDSSLLDKAVEKSTLQPVQVIPAKPTVNKHLFGQQVMETPFGEIKVTSLFALLFFIVVIQFLMLIYVTMKLRTTQSVSFDQLNAFINMYEKLRE